MNGMAKRSERGEAKNEQKEFFKSIRYKLSCREEANERYRQRMKKSK